MTIERFSSEEQDALRELVQERVAQKRAAAAIAAQKAEAARQQAAREAASLKAANDRAETRAVLERMHKRQELLRNLF